VTSLEAPKAVEVSRSLLAGRAQEIQDHHPERTGLTADQAAAVSSVPTFCMPCVCHACRFRLMATR
jgi:hypothetical protein